jgi:hypothetical protein
MHVAIDDASRLAYTGLLADEREESAVAFTGRAVDWFARHGAPVERHDRQRLGLQEPRLPRPAGRARH